MNQVQTLTEFFVAATWAGSVEAHIKYGLIAAREWLRTQLDLKTLMSNKVLQTTATSWKERV